MHRRTLLAAVLGAAPAIAGCIGDPTDGPQASPMASPSPEPTPTATATASPTAEETPSPTPGRTQLVDTAFTVRSIECGEGGEGTYETTIDEEAETVIVTGTIGGRNSCYTAAVQSASYDDDTDDLDVTVHSFEDSDEDEACTTCLVDIEYAAEFSFENGVPESVTVAHEPASDR